MGQYQTFIVRLWTAAAEDSVRGHIQHVASRRGVYFRDMDKMLKFIQECVEPALPPVVTGEEGESSEQELPYESSDRAPDRGGTDDW